MCSSPESLHRFLDDILINVFFDCDFREIEFVEMISKNITNLRQVKIKTIAGT